MYIYIYIYIYTHIHTVHTYIHANLYAIALYVGRLHADCTPDHRLSFVVCGCGDSGKSDQHRGSGL